MQQMPHLPQMVPQQMPPFMQHDARMGVTPDEGSATQIVSGPDISRILNQNPQPFQQDRKSTSTVTACPKFKWALYAFLAGVVSGIFLYFMMTKRAQMMASMKKVADGTTAAVEGGAAAVTQ